MFCPRSWCQAYSVEFLWKTQSRPMQPRECQLFRVTCCLSDKIHTQSGSGNWHCPDCMIHSHTYAHLCIHIRIHAYSLSYVQLYIVFFLNTYTQSIWIIHRCLLLLKASARCSTYTLRKLLFSSFRHSDIFGFGYRFHLDVPPKLHHKWRGTWRTFNHANVFYCTIYIHLIYPFLHAVMCIKYHRWKKKHAWCFSNAFQGILSGDSASFRSNGSALGVAGAQLCQVQLWEVDSRKTCVTLIIWCKLQLPHPFLCNSTALHMNIWMHAHILWAQGFWHTQTCWQFQEFGNCLRSFMPPVNKWTVLCDICTPTVLMHPKHTHAFLSCVHVQCAATTDPSVANICRCLVSLRVPDTFMLILVQCERNEWSPTSHHINDTQCENTQKLIVIQCEKRLQDFNANGRLAACCCWVFSYAVVMKCCYGDELSACCVGGL